LLPGKPGSSLFHDIRTAQQTCVDNEGRCRGLNSVFDTDVGRYIYEVVFGDGEDGLAQHGDVDGVQHGDAFLASVRRVAQKTGTDLAVVLTQSGQHRWTYDCACYNDEKSRSLYIDLLRYYRTGVPAMSLIVDLAAFLTEPLSESRCPAATLSAVLLKVEEMAHYDRRGALRVFDRYGVELLRALEKNRLTPEEVDTVWYLRQRFVDMKNKLGIFRGKELALGGRGLALGLGKEVL
ncbi:unnamed protein product, partial [Amoebophrya sp. A25]